MPRPLLSLSSCLLLASAHLAQAEPEWPSNLAQHEKHWPEQEALVKRDAAIRARMAVEVPRAVRKMSDDPGQKFYFDYWEFAAAEAGADTNQVAIVEGEFLNVTLLPPALKHSEDYGRHWNFPRFFPQGGHGAVQRRDFQCPTGTSACTNIDRPDSCCGISETCQIVEDTGNGDVGCCPEGSSCSGGVANCDSSAGYSSCPNGGCCVPGFYCVSEGCLKASISTTIITEKGTTRTSTLSNTATGQASRRTSITTATTQSRSAEPSSRITSTIAPTSTNAASSTASAVAPLRPTSGSEESSGSLSRTTGTPFESINGCPTGFYMCSAYYQGGCCRVGRDCHSTSCPASASITVVDGNSVTIAGQSGVSFASTTGTCANGWSSCAASQGGGCCPNDYGCGSSCTYTGTGVVSTSAVAKVAPSVAANVTILGWLWVMAGLASGLAMILL
ncbi:uncharacterized protein J3D65DRAFT_636685 [Phyllosticta citribraziliensis]|uniref:GPI anchored protein n=1 Tax=Phyllosticta citribraziliensis TaxID=989973 RepID=A0ABR1LCR3_9PEZI